MQTWRYILLGWLALSLQSANSQENNEKSPFFPKSHGTMKWRPMLAIDTKSTFLANNPMSVYGLRTGFEYKGISRVNVGFFRLAQIQNFEFNFYTVPASSDLYAFEYRGFYGALYYEHAIYRTKRWEIAVPTYLMWGKINSSHYSDVLQAREVLNTSPFTGIGSGLQLQYDLFYWLGPKISIGYRHTFSDQQPANELFNSIYYGLSARVYWKKIYNRFIKPQRN